MDKKDWLSAYIYYSEPWEKLLSAALKPFAEEMLDKGLAEKYFFIRYWDKGPHIRLRFYGDALTLNNQVKPALNDLFGKYFSRNPSRRDEPEWVATLPQELAWLPDNSVQYIAYEPETERYGGNEGIKAAEDHFQDSSRAVLSVIEESSEWDYNRAMGAAIQLHLSFAYGLGMDLDEAKQFYTHTFKSWLPRSYNGYFDTDVPGEERNRRREKTLEAFDATYKKQQESLVPFHQVMWSALESGDEFEEEWLNKWIMDVRGTAGRLEVLQQEGKLVIPYSEHYHSLEGSAPARNKERWAIYDSYVHMTNNRLGIKNQDEGYLGYIIMKSLEELKQLT
jgi:thiopeptide-type bacteriocin biosynthesis protein